MPNFKPPSFYTRLTWANGRTSHSEPWMTLWAAEALAKRLRERWVYLTRRDSIGDGDTCPLFPQHGPMFVLKGSSPPEQWCPHSDHDGTPGKSGPPRSRAKWPLYGFEDSVATYVARLDHAIQRAALPDLSDLEVK